MVKVTGGGRRIGSVAAHLAYISHQGEFDLDTDEGQHVSGEGQKELLRSWHLELSAGQYRQPRSARTVASGIKLVHNITLSMPAPTPARAVLAAARSFAREKFGAKHRYALALHTHQQHPHVHLVVKAEGADGRRLHIDKAMLREWRQDFARMMREQGIAANATSRSVRGQTKRGAKDVFYRTRRHARSYALQEAIDVVKRELRETRTISDPARARLLETRKAVVAAWNAVAARLESHGDFVLGSDVRYFAAHLPPVLTDRERLAVEMIQRAKAKNPERTRGDDRVRDRTLERTR
ncbi:MAG TPA: relaxase/mobilization nuclease domain-containing protein [Steroidobacteraceae bacterium]|nr:relaxase/mobilization nuclease domain-containing protein [Steroidobacteraceae bacterium]